MLLMLMLLMLMLLMLMSFLSWADLVYTVFMCVSARASIYVAVVDVAVHVSTSAL